MDLRGRMGRERGSRLYREQKPVAQYTLVSTACTALIYHSALVPFFNVDAHCN